MIDSLLPDMEGTRPCLQIGIALSRELHWLGRCSTGLVTWFTETRHNGGSVYFSIKPPSIVEFKSGLFSISVHLTTDLIYSSSSGF